MTRDEFVHMTDEARSLRQAILASRTRRVR